MEGEYRGTNAIWCTLEVFCHSLRDCERGHGCPTSEESFVFFGDGHERMSRTFGARKDCPTIIVPIDYKMCISKEADHECDEESGDRRWVLDSVSCGSEG